uniref:tripartite motif-containing protein 10-like n=1 Tax=Podarcis muralis TaxID=64176 RepID=UPI00109F9EDD|nr:tripartite motif-containing protein 10-like [Podarcis muralis]
MASASPSVDMDQDALCPICKDYLTDPVTLDCGHNYCQGCVTSYCKIWEEQAMGHLECPICRAQMQRGSFRPNWQLASIVEKIKLLQLNKGGKDMCVKHKKYLELFCKEDEKLVCVACERSPEHKSHTVVLEEEAAQEYKGLICSHLEILRKERETILAYQADTEKESQDLLKLTETERQKIVEKFRKLYRFLEEQEVDLLNQIEEVEKEIEGRRDEQLARLSRELSSLKKLIQEMEEKSQQAASELLQDVRSTLQRYERRERLQNLLAFPLKLKWKASRFCDVNLHLEDVIKQFKDAVLFKLQFQKANVTLDPDTAHARLILSEDQKSVRRRGKKPRLPNNPERFSNGPCVLGREGFTAGRHFWEVTVGSEGEWVVGIARESVRRKDNFAFCPEGGIWAVEKWGGKYLACTSPVSHLSLREEPRRIRVTLDYEGERVSFFDAASGAELYTFSGASFSGETLLPFFYLWGNKTHLRIS